MPFIGWLFILVWSAAAAGDGPFITTPFSVAVQANRAKKEKEMLMSGYAYTSDNLLYFSHYY